MSEKKKETLLQLLDPPFPLIFKGLLPNGSHFQMTKSRLSRECAVCERIYTVFFWKNNNVPFRTCICQICARGSNVCQVSLLDLDTGIPVIVRNKFLQQQADETRSKVRIWYDNRILDKMIERGEEWLDVTFRERILKFDPVAVNLAQQFVQADPYLSFKKPHVCQDWLTANCIYGESCHYAHVLPGPGEYSPNSSKHGVRGRFLGTLDPNGSLIIDKLAAAQPTIFKKPKEEKRDMKEIEKVFTPEKERQEDRSVMTLPAEFEPIYSYSKPIGYDLPSDARYIFPPFIGDHFEPVKNSDK